MARLRAECHRLGIRDVSITGTEARLAPLRLRTSEEMRLRRLARGRVYKEDLRQLVVPLPRGADPAIVPGGVPARAGDRRAGNFAGVNRALLGAGALALALSFTASACSGARPDAATVNGTTIERRAFEDELQPTPATPAWTSQQQTPSGAGEGTVTMDFTDQMLQRKILLELIRQENERAGSPSPRRSSSRPRQRAAVHAPLGEPPLTTAWNAFPESFRKQAIEETAQYLTLSEALGGGALDDAALQKLYDENPAKFGQACIRHILVATEEEAKDLKAQLDAGADFSDAGHGQQHRRLGQRRRAPLHRGRRTARRPPATCPTSSTAPSACRSAR